MLRALCIVIAFACGGLARDVSAQPQDPPAVNVDTDPCDTLLKATDLSADDAMKAAVRCAGWIDSPDETKHEGRATLPGTRAQSAVRGGNVAFALESIPAAALANEFFSLIAEIAVDRARRQGLSLIKERIENGVCGVKFASPEALVLPATCALVTSTDLQALVGQGRALRTALTADVVGVVEQKAFSSVDTMPPLGNSARAALALVRRFAGDPGGTLTKNDVWLVVDAFLNTPWTGVAESGDLKPLKYGIAAARSYIQALQMTREIERGRVDLAIIIRQIKIARRATGLDGAAAARVIEYSNLAVKSVLAVKPDTSEDDYRERLRSALRLVLDALTTLRTGSTIVLPAWARDAALAALDADAPHLVATLADIARAKLIKDCTGQGDCRQTRKFSVLLTGVATYALTYDRKIPDSASPEQRLAFLKDQREARKEALESVIDAATDRRGREGTAVWSLGVGVGGSLWSRQRLDLTTTRAGQPAAKEQPLGVQLHVPLGIAYQLLPSRNWFHPLPIHVMLTVLDLANYVGKTTEPNSSPDWRAIIAPGMQVGVAVPGLSRANNLVLVGYALTYAPQFLETPAASGAGSASFRGARRRGLFVTYYVPLWDF